MIPMNAESRRHAGVTLIQLHRINGETAEIDAYDARQTVRNHPDEWSFTAWPIDVQKKAQKDPSIVHFEAPESQLLPSYIHAKELADARRG